MLLWTLGCMYLFELLFSFFPDICPGVELLDHMVVLILVFWRTFLTVSIVAALIYLCSHQECIRVPLSQHTLQHIFIWLLCAACEILGPWPGIELGPVAMKVWSLNHWATREVPSSMCYLQAFWWQPFLQVWVEVLYHFITFLSSCSHHQSKGTEQPGSFKWLLYNPTHLPPSLIPKLWKP